LLWSLYGIGQTIKFLPCGFFLSFFLFSLPNLSGRRLDVTILRHMIYPWYEFRMQGSEMCCKRLAGNTGRKNDAKNRRQSTITQLCRAISSQLTHVPTIRQKLVKQQYLLQISLQYGELWPTNGSDVIGGFGAPHHISTGIASWQRYCLAVK